MRYLITGATGMLGRDLQRAFAGRNVTALGRTELDITDPRAVGNAAADHDVIINAAAYTAVDDAESHEEDARRVNALGAENLAMAAAKNQARLVQLSTDYVFDGRATTPYPEDAPLNPISAYGRTKAEGERRAVAANPNATFIVRTAWLYGEHGVSFPNTMLRLARSHESLPVVDDQFGQPTWTWDLACRIRELIDADAVAGAYHGTNSGLSSWFEFAQEAFRLVGLDPDRVTRTESATFRRPAPRPSYSVLGHSGWERAGLGPMRHWRTALNEAVGEGVLKRDDNTARDR